MRFHRCFRALQAVAAAAVFATSALEVQAQQNLAIDRFDPAPAGDRMFGVPSPYVAGSFTPYGMVMGDYAHNPFVIRTTEGNQSRGILVGSQLFLHLNAGLSLWKRLLVNVDVPVALVNSGDSAIAGLSLASPNQAAFGDLRLGLRVRLWGDDFDLFQVALGGYVWLPTGAAGAFVSDGAVRGLPQVIVGGRGDRWVYAAALGPNIRAAQRFPSESQAGFMTVDQGTMLNWGVGLGVLLLDNRRLQIGPELSGAFTLSQIQKRNINAELLFDVRYRVAGIVELGAGVGPGLSSGVGTPDVRGVFMVAYAPEPKRDRDRDEIPDANDACPDVKGLVNPDPKKNGCPVTLDRDSDDIPDSDDACIEVKGVADRDPVRNGCPPDRDRDGIPDAGDACPDVKGLPSPNPRLNGCPPPDRDGDGIPDGEDACMGVKGVRTSEPKTHGCPPDRDADSVVDPDDACPDQAGPRNTDPTKNGCPMVQLTATEVAILDQVQFDVDRATIKPVSDALLDNVAAVIKDHAELHRIEVQGHTDDRGLPARNKKLSAARADAVLKALVKRKVEKKRLSAVGYGQDKPIADNATEQGRQKNRRVQFVILERSPAAGR